MTNQLKPSKKSIREAFEIAKKSGVFCDNFLNQGLSIALGEESFILSSGNIEIPSYKGPIIIERVGAGLGKCRCPIYCGGNVWCKHRIAASLLVRGKELEQDFQKSQESPKTEKPEQSPEVEQKVEKTAVVPPVGGQPSESDAERRERRERHMKALWG